MNKSQLTLLVASLFAISPIASGQNTVDNYTGASNGSLLTAGNWSAGLPSVSNDAVFTATTGIRTITAGSLTVGSFNVTATSGTFTIRNETTGATNSTLTLGGAGNLGNAISGTSADLLYAAAGSTFTITGPNGSSGTGTLGVVLGQSGNFNSAGSINISAAISGGFGITKTGNGSLTLSGANSYTGVTTIATTASQSGSQLIANNALALGSTANGTNVGLNTSLVIGSGVTISGESLTIEGSGFSSSAFGALVTNVGGSPATWNGGVFLNGTFSRIGARAGTQLTVSGVIANGTGSTLFLTGESGTGVIILSAANTYTGPTNIVRGVIKLGLDNSLPVTTVLDVQAAGTDAATLDLNNFNQTLAGLKRSAAASSTVKNSGPNLRTLTLDTSTNNTYSGTIIGANLALTKSGSGTQVLSGANTYTGNTTLTAGTINLGVAENVNVSGPLGKQLANAAGTIILNGGTLQYSAANTNDYSGRFSTAANQAYNVDTNGQSVIWATALTSSGGTLTKSGSGVLTLSAANAYTGFTAITTGTLQLNGSTHANSTVAVGTAGSLTGTGTVNGNATLTGGGIINKSAGNIAGTLNITGGNWNGAGSVTGLITSSSGTFSIGSGANLTANGDLNVSGGNIVAVDSTSTITGSLNYTSSTSSTFAGAIVGSGKTLTMNNASATLTLGGTNTYGGITTVNAGTLVVTGSLANNGPSHILMAAPDNDIAGNPVLTRAITPGLNTYAGFGSKVTATSLDQEVTPNAALQTSAEILMSGSTAAANLSMSWRNRTNAEALPSNPNAVLSDVISLTGMNVGTIYVLSMSYNDLALGMGGLNLDEDAIAASGELRLGWNDGGVWETATDGNSAGPSGSSFAGVMSWTDFVSANGNFGASNLGNYLGKYGVDKNTNTVWAVLDHNSEFAVIPEPSTLIAGGLAIVGLAGFGMRLRRHNL